MSNYNTQLTIYGRQQLLESFKIWDQSFQSLDDQTVTCTIGRISALDDCQLKVNWNVTWVPPTALWLKELGQIFQWTLLPVTYNHLSQDTSVYSWKAIQILFAQALSEGCLRIPLACIEGQTTLVFDTIQGKLAKVSEELTYANQLQQRSMKNRRCASDLKLFLECARRPSTVDSLTWVDTVSQSLPWESVPGMGVMDLEPLAVDEQNLPYAFLATSLAILVSIFNILASNILF